MSVKKTVESAADVTADVTEDSGAGSSYRVKLKRVDITSWYFILAGCVLVWFLSCNETCAVYIAEHKNIMTVLAGIIYFMVFCSAIYKKKDTRTIIGLLFLGGFLLRAFYVLTSSHDVTIHDIGSFCGFDTEESGDGHFGYIEYIFKNHQLPDFDPRTRWSFYQPPGFYIAASIVLGITRLFHVEAPLCYESLQIVTLFFSSMTVWIGYKIIREFDISDRWTILFTAFLTVHPFYSIMAVTITNDCMAMYFMALAILYTIRWYKSHELKKIMVIAFAVGGAMFTKLNSAVISIGIAFIFLYVLWTNRRQWKKYIGQFAAFLSVCAPLGLFYPVRNMILYQMPLSYIQSINTTDASLYISDASVWSRLGLPSWDMKNHAIYEFLPNLNCNVWVMAIRTSLFDELMPDVGSSLFGAIAQAILWIAILLVILMNAALLISCGKKYGMKAEMRIFLLSVYASLIISYVVFCFKEPLLCTMNYRYLPIAFLFPMIGTALWLQNYSGNSMDNNPKKRSRIFYSAVLCVLCAFIVLSVIIDFDFIAWSGTKL
ncbi:MAG: glycosyltransferase family 39 protein [Lachnospiraceae bacterium]|nr:glycosyltransferase family 39 protein [Lachnospiraceae bacterium]